MIKGSRGNTVTMVNSKEQAAYQGKLPKIELKSLILAQIERWRHALHMQVER